MSRQTIRLWVALLVALSVGSASAPAHAWGGSYLSPKRSVRATPPDQSWLMDIPEKAGARSKRKVAVFVFRGDDVYEPVRGEVVRVLRRRGLNVTATLRPVDSAAQYRELSQSLNLAVYVEGELKGEGPRQSARIRLRSGMTGEHIASATFSGPTRKIVADVRRNLWARVGTTMVRACSSKWRPRRPERAPLHIEAGTPLEDTFTDTKGT